MRGKVIGVVTILLLAPITAELLQAYLGDLDGPLGMLVLVVFLSPLYGGIALLIREVSVRTGRGWTGRLLLATAFGVGMATIIDLSLFTERRADIDGWSDIFNAASWGGIGWYAVVTWVGGHVLMSVSVPIVVAESLAQRPGPWLGPVGLLVVGAGFLTVAYWLHIDQGTISSATASSTEYTVAGFVVASLTALAFTPLGRPLPTRPGGTPSVLVCAIAGFVGMAAFDLVPASWTGVAIDLTVLLISGILISRWLSSALSSQRHLAALAFGALLARTLTGFLSPLPQDTTWPEKIGQNATYLIVVLLLGWALHRRTRRKSGLDWSPRSSAA